MSETSCVRLLQTVPSAKHCAGVKYIVFKYHITKMVFVISQGTEQIFVSTCQTVVIRCKCET